METATTAACCSNPGCDQPGTNKCSACKTTPYCGPICQTTHWARHKEECEGHLLKIGNAHLAKAKGFIVASNWAQVLQFSDLALGKLNAMKKGPIEAISQALAWKFIALQNLGRQEESLQSAKDKYNLWAMARGPAHPSTIDAAFFLIEGLLHNNEYEDAHFFAHTLWEIIHTNNHVDNDIPGDKWQHYVAMAAHLLAQAIWRLAESGGIPPEEKQKAGEEAIARARQSLDIYTQLHGAECQNAGNAMGGLASVLDYFDDGGDNSEVPRLYEQSITIHARVTGRTSVDVGESEFNFGLAYYQRASKAHAVQDLDRNQANLELALPHFREAARIFTAIKQTDLANEALRNVADIEERLRFVRAIARG